MIIDHQSPANDSRHKGLKETVCRDRFLFFFGCAESSLLCRFSLVESWGYSLVAVHGLLIAVASLVAEHGLEGARDSQLQPVGSVVGVPGF